MAADGTRLVAAARSRWLAAHRYAVNKVATDLRAAAPYATGAYDATYATPMLLVHGVADPGVSSAISEAVFAQTPGPMSLLLLNEGDHTSLFGGEDGVILDRVLVAWLDQELDIDPTATTGLEEEVAATNRGSLRSKAS